MLKEPKLFRQFLSPQEVENFREMIAQFKTSPELRVDSNYFYRRYIYDHSSLVSFHRFLATLISRILGQKVRPTYSFVSMYDPGAGDCPLHIDRSPCELTVDICINHTRPWPLYVNHTTAFRSENDLVLHAQAVKDESVEYLLSPGDALFYSGTEHPHWRNKIDPDNFCDLIFFHFTRA